MNYNKHWTDPKTFSSYSETQLKEIYQQALKIRDDRTAYQIIMEQVRRKKYAT